MYVLNFFSLLKINFFKKNYCFNRKMFFKNYDLILNLNFNTLDRFFILKKKIQKKIKNNFNFKAAQLGMVNSFSFKTEINQNSSKIYFVLNLLKLLSIWLIALLFSLIVFFFLSNIRNISFNKVLFEWFLIIMFLYWLLSGFVFFIKKYQYSKYTSVIQRFWRRSFILFWLIEGGVFVTFFYLTLNSSEEPVFMYDQLKLFKTHLFSWRLFFLKIILNIYLVLIAHYLIISLNWSNYRKQNLIVLFITLLLLYFLWLEFYQFFHIVNFFGNIFWVFDSEEFIWNLEIEFRRTRMPNNYVALCLIAKFWHLVFIFVFWIFFVLRVNELGRIRYPLLSANNQNFLILYLMSWLFMYPWLKFLVRGLYDINYYWFLNNTNKTSFRIFFNDLKLFYFNIGLNLNNELLFKSSNFFYFFESSITQLNSFKKHFLKDFILLESFF